MPTDESSSSLFAPGEESGAFKPAFVRRPIPPPSPFDQPFTHERLPGIPPGFVINAALITTDDQRAGTPPSVTAESLPSRTAFIRHT